MKNKIEIDGIDYAVKEPTVTDWANVMKYKTILDEEELYYKMLEEFTGMSKDEILSKDAGTIVKIGDIVQTMLLKENQKLYPSIEHNGIKYNLVDVHSISFGQYVDIDTFLRKNEQYKVQNMNELAAYLYCEAGTKYADSNIKNRIEKMKDLPIKYVNSSLFFLLNTAKASHDLTNLFSKSKLMWKVLKIRLVFHIIGDGIKQLVHSQKTKFGRLIMWLISPLLALSIILVTLLTSIRKRRKKLKSSNNN